MAKPPTGWCSYELLNNRGLFWEMCSEQFHWGQTSHSELGPTTYQDTQYSLSLQHLHSWSYAKSRARAAIVLNMWIQERHSPTPQVCYDLTGLLLSGQSVVDRIIIYVKHDCTSFSKERPPRLHQQWLKKLKSKAFWISQSSLNPKLLDNY